MPFEYSAENHDWDLTLRASWNLLMSGQAVRLAPKLERKNEQEFSFLTGSMLLAFCSIESFTSSIAFSMSDNEKFKDDFDYEEYKKLARFWETIERVCTVLDFQIDKSQGLFQTIKEMQVWRNVLTHASPYEIEKTIIQDTKDEPHKLHKPFKNKEYAKYVNVEAAKKFYSAAIDYIELIKTKSGLEPRSSCSYRNLG